MKIVSMGGGLGNQMFKYAFALALKKEHPGEEVMIDSRLCRYMGAHNGYELSRLFDLELPEASWIDVRRVSKRASVSVLYKLNPGWYDKYVAQFYDNKDVRFIEDYQEPGKYNEIYLKSLDSLYYDIGAQAWQYFEGMERQLGEAFGLKKPMDISFIEKEREIGSLLYLTNLYYDCGYYEHALQLVKEKFPDFKLYVFTNDTKHCDALLGKMLKGMNFELIRNQGENSYKDIFLMKKCQALIIANSSFSWWGAWLNDREGKTIVAPKEWILNAKAHAWTDICPPDWIRI